MSPRRQGGPPAQAAPERQRLDTWLWAARFFKTRSLCAEAIHGGKVHLNGQRAKPASPVSVGDRLTITRGVEHYEITVAGLNPKRRPAREAVQLYRESDESRQRREEQAELRRLHAASMPAPARRPDKKARRHIIRFRRKGEGA